jgi:hypothetical protein
MHVRRRSPPRSLRGDRAAVSDIIGSVLLIGITVIAATAFGLLLFSFKGPADTQHTQLAISVGPGADGDWGAGDAELRILHAGGEPLLQGATTVTYVESGGTAQTVSPVFPGGSLTLGQNWTKAITALPGDTIPVRVAVSGDNIRLLLANSIVRAGSHAPSIVWVSAVAPTTGNVQAGSSLAGAQSSDDLDAALVLEEGATAGSPTPFTQTPTGTAGSTASNPGGVTTNGDSSFAQLAAGQFVQASYGAPAGVSVSQVRLNAVMKATQTTSTVANDGLMATGTVTGSAQNFVQTSTTVTAPAGAVLLAAVSNGNSNVKDVLTVTGPPGVTWSRVGQVSNNAGGLEVWIGLGTPSSAAAVKATFATKSGSDVPNTAAIAVSRYTGVDASSALQAVQATTSGEGPGSMGSSTASLSGIAGTATKGMFYAASNGVASTGFTFTSPGTERVDLDAGPNKVQLAVADGTAAASGNALSAAIGSQNDWQAISLTLRPFTSPLPQVTMSYTVNGTAGTTTLSPGLSGGLLTYTMDVTGDRAWTRAAIGQIVFRVNYGTGTGATVQVDHLSVTGTIVATPTTYSLNARLDFAFGTLSMGTASETLQMRYHTNGVDSFNVTVLTGSTPRPCGTLASTTYTVFSCALILPGEHNSGTPSIRITDVNSSGTTRGTLSIEYARVAVL